MVVLRLLLSVLSGVFLLAAADSRAEDLRQALENSPLLDGGTFSAADYEESVVLLHFWTPYCFACPQEVQSLEKLARALLNTHVRIVGVIAKDVSPRALAAAKEMKLQIPNIVDKDLALGKKFEVAMLPATIIIGADGELLEIPDPDAPQQKSSRFVGPRGWMKDNVVQALVNLE